MKSLDFLTVVLVIVIGIQLTAFAQRGMNQMASPELATRAKHALGPMISPMLAIKSNHSLAKWLHQN